MHAIAADLDNASCPGGAPPVRWTREVAFDGARLEQDARAHGLMRTQFHRKRTVLRGLFLTVS